MYWPPEVKEKLHALMADTPPRHKQYIQPIIKSAVEMIANRLGKSDIDEECLVHAYIVCVPRHLREGIGQVLSDHNYDLLYFRSVFDEPVITDGILSNHEKPAANPKT